MIPLPLSTLLDALVLAGHQDTLRSTPPSESRGDDDGGIGVAPILAVLLLALVTVILLVSLSSPDTKAKLKAFAPLALIAVVIAGPLVVWAASSGGGEKKLIVERWINDAGTPELIVSLGDDDLNALETTNGKGAVRVQCRGRDGQMVVDVKQKWPFINERGYDFPHIHQPASRVQVQQADRCVVLGTRVRLEAEVEGALTG